MIKLICDNQLLYRTLSNYLIQKDILLASSNDIHQIVIEIQDREKSIILNINGCKIDISLPIDINFLNSQILKKIIDINFPIGSYKYFPYQRVISNNHKKALLSEIQNLIISNLIVNKEGIDKDNLYNLIWKRDKFIWESNQTHIRFIFYQSLGVSFVIRNSSAAPFRPEKCDGG